MGWLRGAVISLACVLAIGVSDADAFTENLGATTFPDTGEATGCFSSLAGEPCNSTWALINVPGGIVATPSSAGTITSWRVRAHLEHAGSVRLVVLRANANGSYTATAISEPAGDVVGNPNPTSLPIKAGYYIGATTSTEGPEGASDIFGVKAAAYAAWFSGFTQLEQAFMPNDLSGHIATEIGAEVALAPVANSLSPTGGPAGGGTAVTIKGKYLSDATKVLFGSTPATGLKANEIETLQATAPAGVPGSTVDVRVVGPAGTSVASPAMRFTYASPASASPIIAPLLVAPASIATVSAVSQTNSTFVVGRASTPLTGTTATRHRSGTVFSFTLDRPATVNVAISRSSVGRRVGRACLAPRKGVAPRPKCSRYTAVATLVRTAHSGLNKLAFTGRIKGKALRPGHYQARFTATTSAGSSVARTLTFTIVTR